MAGAEEELLACGAFNDDGIEIDLGDVEASESVVDGNGRGIIGISGVLGLALLLWSLPLTLELVLLQNVS